MTPATPNASRTSDWPGVGASDLCGGHFMGPQTLTFIRRANVTKAPARPDGQALALRLRRAPGQDRKLQLLEAAG